MRSTKNVFFIKDKSQQAISGFVQDVNYACIEMIQSIGIIVSADILVVAELHWKGCVKEGE